MQSFHFQVCICSYKFLTVKVFKLEVFGFHIVQSLKFWSTEYIEYRENDFLVQVTFAPVLYRYATWLTSECETDDTVRRHLGRLVSELPLSYSKVISTVPVDTHIPSYYKEIYHNLPVPRSTTGSVLTHG